METKLIECKSIDVPKVESSKRTFSKEFAVKLSDSLKIDGQINPVVVRPNVNTPGRYVLVAGRHRLYGMKVVLKEQFIRATIAEGMSDVEASMAADVENLWRNPLNKAQTAGALKRWHAHWIENLPAEPAAKPATKAPESAHSEHDALPAPAAESVKDSRESDFNEKVAAATGQSVGSVRRLKALANAFTEDQLEVFTHMGTAQVDMLTISKIKDVKKRGEVVILVATGMKPDDAITEVMKGEAPERYNKHEKQTEADKEAKKAMKAAKEPELTDDEWFVQNCGEKAAMFGDPAKFKADALLFRSVSELRHTFRVKGKGFLAAAKKAGITGPFFNLVNRFISISHPKDWLLCPTCTGYGVSKTDDNGTACKCPKCFGGGYLLKTEEFL